MQNAEENSGSSFWGKVWEVAKPHAGHVAGQAGQFAVDRYGQPIKDKFNHLIPVKGEDVSAADLAQVDPVQMEQAEESRAAHGASEVDPASFENDQSGIDDGQAGVVQGGASADGEAVNVGDGSGVDGTAAQGETQDVGRAGQGNDSPSRNAGQNGQMGNADQQKGGASQQNGGAIDNMEGDSPNDIPDQWSRGDAAGNRAGDGGNQGTENTASLLYLAVHRAAPRNRTLRRMPDSTVTTCRTPPLQVKPGLIFARRELPRAMPPHLP